MKKLIRNCILLSVSCLFSGCPAQWFCNFYNDTNVSVTVAMGSAVVKDLAPGKTAKLPFSPGSGEEVKNREIVVYSENGQILSRTNALKMMLAAKANGAEYPNNYIIISKKSIVPAKNQHP